jgi:hypothetical protein
MPYYLVAIISVPKCSLYKVAIPKHESYKLQGRRQESLDLCYEISIFCKNIKKESHSIAKEMDAERVDLMG